MSSDSPSDPEPTEQQAGMPATILAQAEAAAAANAGDKNPLRASTGASETQTHKDRDPP